MRGEKQGDFASLGKAILLPSAQAAADRAAAARAFA